MLGNQTYSNNIHTQIHINGKKKRCLQFCRNPTVEDHGQLELQRLSAQGKNFNHLSIQKPSKKSKSPQAQTHTQKITSSMSNHFYSNLNA